MRESRMWRVFYVALAAGLVVGVILYAGYLLGIHDLIHNPLFGIPAAALAGILVGFSYYLFFKLVLRAFTRPFLKRAQALTTRPIDPLEPLWVSTELDKLEEVLDEALATLERLDLFSSIAREIVATLEPQQTLGRIVGTAVETLDANAGLIFLRDEESECYKLSASYLLPLSDEQVDQLSFPVGEGVPAWVTTRGEPLIIPNAQTDERVHPLIQESGMKSLVSVPLVAGEEPLGVLNLFSIERGDTFDEHDVYLLSIYADLAAVAIQNTRLYRAVEDERQKLSAILADTTDVILVLDHAGEVMLVNAAAARAFEIDVETAIGRPVNVLGVDDLRAALEAARTADGPVLREIDAPGERTLYASVSPVRDVGWVMVMQDISHLKELDRLRTEWVAAVSHDLKNPITSIELAAQLIEKAGPLNEMQEEILQKMRRGSGKLRSLVTDVLDLARVEAGPPLKATEIETTNIVADTIGEIAAQAEDKDLTLITDIPTDLPPLWGDAALLSRALVNILSNAVKYTHGGGKVTVSATAQNGKVALAISDTGCGIPAEALPHLFERFYRVPGSEEEAEGTGLGLSIVQSIVEKHGGEIHVESEEGVGSTFTLLIPAG